MEAIKKLVQDYKKVFPDEYRAVIDIVAEKRKGNKFAEIKGDFLERGLSEYPETLFNLFATLPNEEQEFLKSKKGILWFAKTFKEFSLCEKI